MMQETKNGVRPLMVVIKGLMLFLIINFSFTLPWSAHLGKLTLRNRFFPGNERFVGSTNFDILFANHVISKPKLEDEYRVVLLGDSSVVGAYLNYEDTVNSRINKLELRTCDGKQVRAYNLGSPFMSTLKDFMILDAALDYDPDMVVWFVSLNTFTTELRNKTINQQYSPTLVQNNMDRVVNLFQKYKVNPTIPSKLLTPAGNVLWNKTLIEQRPFLSELVDKQLAAINEISTFESENQKPYAPVPYDLSKSLKYRNLKPPVSDDKLVNLDLFETALSSVANIQVLIVNEPIYISQGKNSDIRYNNDYPRWAYDQYRGIMAHQAELNHWNYLDLWDLVPAEEFTNTPFHRTSEGDSLVAKKVSDAILNMVCP